MTVQSEEVLLYEGKTHGMYSEPLSKYVRISECLKLNRKSNELIMICSSIRRGYVGTWEVINNRLYLIELYTIPGYKSLEIIFNNYPSRIFAHWYTGRLCLPQGEILNRNLFGRSTYERYLFIDVQKGKIIGSDEVKSPDNTSEQIESQREYEDFNFPIKSENLLNSLSIEEIEASEIISDPLNAVPQLPFGHLNDTWLRFKDNIQADDEVWSFSELVEPEYNTKFNLSGYVIVRLSLPTNIIFEAA